MNTNVTRTGNELTLTITANEADLAPTVRSTFNQLRTAVSAKGFRPGKAPNNVIERELGTDRVQSEILDAAAEKLYRQASAEHDVRAISHPHVEVKKFVPYTELEIEVKVDVMPEIKLGNYKDIEVKPEEATVSESEVEDVLVSIQNRLAERDEVDRAAEEGDEVVLDFHGRKDGEDVPGAQAKEYPLLLGSDRFIPGFEERLIGLGAGDEKTFTVKFPADYGEASLAGQEVDFSVKIHKVLKLTIPEANDAFAKTAGPFESLEQLKSDVTDHLKSEKEQTLRRKFEAAVVDTVVDKSKVEIPQSMLEAERERIEADFESRLSEQGIDKDEYLKQTKQSEKKHQEALESQAERRIKSALVLTKLADAEGITVTPEELEVRVQVLAGQYQDEKIQSELQKPEIRRDIANEMLAEKTVAKLVEYATGDDKSDDKKTK